MSTAAAAPPPPTAHAPPHPTPLARTTTLERILFPLGALLFYAAITAGFLLATSAPLRTQFIGDGGDNWQFVWNAWWLKRCILEFSNPYFCPLLFAPDGAPLTMHNLTIVPTLAMLAVGCFLPMPLAYNIIVVSFFPLAGLSGCALARYVTRDRLGAIVGGAVFMICPFLTSKTLGHLNLLGAAFLPLYTLCLLRALDEPTRMRRVWLTLVFLLIVFTNEHTLIFAANITVWLGLFRAWPGRTWKAEALKFWQVLKPAAVFSLAWAAFLAYYAMRYGAVPYRTGALAYCPEPLNFILPLFPNSVWCDAVAPPGELRWQMTTLELAVYLGWLALPLAVAGYRCSRSLPLMRFMGILFVGSLVLAWGPKLQWHRQPLHVLDLNVHLPMKLYALVPVLGSVGQSGRYMVIGYMAMSVALAGLIGRLRARRGLAFGTVAAALVLVLVGADYGCRLWYTPVPTCPIPPGSRRVMDLRRNRGPAMYLQTIHGRPLIGGYLARYPAGAFDRYTSTPGVAWFFTPAGKRGQPPNGDELRAGLRALDVEYVCADGAGEERRALDGAGLECVCADALGMTFRVSP